MHSSWIYSVYPNGGYIAARIHARLHGWAGSSRPEQNHAANPNCAVITVVLWTTVLTLQ